MEETELLEEESLGGGVASLLLPFDLLLDFSLEVDAGDLTGSFFEDFALDLDGFGGGGEVIEESSSELSLVDFALDERAITISFSDLRLLLSSAISLA